MKVRQHTLNMQIDLIQQAMKQAGVWSEETPDWAYSFSKGSIPDFWQWMQFVYLPMRLTGSYTGNFYLAPQLQAIIENDPALTPILQLTIELDSLTPTFHP